MTETILDSIDLHPTRCAICQTEGNATQIYPANFDQSIFNATIFSARRLPDGIHYRMVRCNTCGLVRSDPVADAEILARLYARSIVTYDDEIPDLKYTYGRYLERVSRYQADKGVLLEVGCGNGFFLAQALAQGYSEVWGVEPSVEAVQTADPLIRSRIVCNVMRPQLFDPNRFDVICLFQVFDHISDPGEVLEECYRVLKPGGLLLCLNHNVEAVSARLLRDRSPIVDVEHTYLYSPTTIVRLAKAHQFLVREVGAVYNRYALRYLARLLPLPKRLKHSLILFLKDNRIGRIRVSVPLGNLYLIGQKQA
jgi:SAM-dependent methyltransferase